jgi:hypothetical protein
MARILSILVLVVALVAAIDVLKTVRETEKRILWLLVIILLPLIGSLLWYLVSRRIIKL